MPVKINEPHTSFSFFHPKCDKALSKTFPSRIYQIVTKNAHQKFFCGLRLAKRVELGALRTDDTGYVTITLHCTHNEKNYITDLDISEYIEGDFMYVTSDGHCILRNMETGNAIFRGKHSDSNGSKENEMTPWLCHFASHPRSFVLANSSEFTIRDCRTGCRPQLSIFNTDSEFLQSNEKLCTAAKSGINEGYLHYLTTSYSLFLLDERYPGHPILTWKHQMMSPPRFCCPSIYSKGDKVREAVALGAKDSREIVLINTEHDGLRKSISLCPPLHLSTSKDFVSTLVHSGYQVDPVINERTDLPLQGLMSTSSDNGQLTVFHCTVIGDVYYQDFLAIDKDSQATSELGHGHGPGYVPYQFSTEVATCISRWVDDATMQSGQSARPKTTHPGQTKPQVPVVCAQILVPPLGSSRCTHCADNSSSELCPYCGRVGRSQQPSTQMAQKVTSQQSVILGEVNDNVLNAETGGAAVPFSAVVTDSTQSSDKLLRKMLETWNTPNSVSSGSNKDKVPPTGVNEYLNSSGEGPLLLPNVNPVMPAVDIPSEEYSAHLEGDTSVNNNSVVGEEELHCTPLVEEGAGSDLIDSLTGIAPYFLEVMDDSVQTPRKSLPKTPTKTNNSSNVQGF